MNCFVCEEEFELMTGFNMDDETGQAWHGNVFICYGSYGSTVFDPPMSSGGNHYLRVTICDSCLTAKAKSGLIKVVTQTPRAPLVDVGVWDPNLT